MTAKRWNRMWSPREIRNVIHAEQATLSRIGDRHIASKSKAGEAHNFSTCKFCQSLADEMKGMQRISHRFGGRSS